MRILKLFTPPAIPENHPQFCYFKSAGHSLKKRAVFLGEICAETTTIAVAGTHGKTTTSAILTHLFHHAKQSFSAFLGGIVNHYNSNFISTGFDFAIVEADEFDRSFLNLKPEYAGITSIDPDHLDIYHTAYEFKETFNQFASQVSTAVVTVKGLEIKGLTFALEEPADYGIENITQSDSGYYFDVQTPTAHYKNVCFNQMGKHNLKNALCAIALTDMVGISLDNALGGLSTFSGIKRRMNKHLLKDKVLIDDYAHHPTEIQSVWETIQSFYPKKKNTVIFQPHLFSRTQDFMADFATALAPFDEVILLDIYPARELPIAGVDSEALLEKIPNPQKKKIEKKELIPTIMATEAEVITVLGAGDIGEEVTKIVSHFQS